MRGRRRRSSTFVWYDTEDLDALMRGCYRRTDIHRHARDLSEQFREAHAMRTALPRAFLADNGVPYRVVMTRLLREL